MKIKENVKPKLANVLYAVKKGARHVNEISELTNISKFMVQKHLKCLIAIGSVRMQVEKGVAGITMREMNYHYFMHDNEDLISQYLDMPKQETFKSTPFLQKMFGYTEPKNIKGGRTYDERSIKKIMMEKGIDVWNPVNRKSPKNFVKGGTLLNI
jgi:hypothetical protein